MTEKDCSNCKHFESKYPELPTDICTLCLQSESSDPYWESKSK